MLERRAARWREKVRRGKNGKSDVLPSGTQPFEIIGAPGRIRTHDPQIRSLVLYPAELPVH